MMETKSHHRRLRRHRKPPPPENPPPLPFAEDDALNAVVVALVNDDVNDENELLSESNAIVA